MLPEFRKLCPAGLPTLFADCERHLNEGSDTWDFWALREEGSRSPMQMLRQFGLVEAASPHENRSECCGRCGTPASKV